MKKNQILGAIIFFIFFASIGMVINSLLSVPNALMMAITGAIGGFFGTIAGYEMGKNDTAV